MIRFLLAFTFLGGTAFAADDREAAPAPKKWIDLTGYHTTKDVIKADPKSFPATATPGQLGYLGLALAENAGKIVVEDVETGSPAAEAGLKAGEVLASIDGQPAGTVTAAREKLKGKMVGASVNLVMEHNGTARSVTLKYKPLSKPFASLDAPRAILGLQVVRARDGGIEITSLTGGGGAEKAGLRVGDVILKVNDTQVDNDSTLREVLSEKKAGDVVKLLVLRDKKETEMPATLMSASTGGGNPGWDDRLPSPFRKPVYKLAIIGVEYPDVKHNEKIEGKHWEEALFSQGTYTSKNATGQNVYGSVADYYQELSYGKLKLEGKFLGWVEVGKKKMDYNLGSSTNASDKSKFFNEMMDKVVAKHGKSALKDYDGVFVVFAGDRVQTSRGGLYWPHRASFNYDRQRYNYFIVPEQSSGRGGGGRFGGGGEQPRGEGRMTDISVICHEFGHMLGLPDLYARPENPGSEGVGVWCAMSNQLPNGRPQHFSAWSKEQMGWIKPTPIDPRVKQKIVLSPIEESGSECLKVLVRADGSEYFLLENRQKRGWDRDLPAEGLLIWRVIPGTRGTQQVYVEEAHGVEGPTGPRVYTGSVPFPSPANHSFTPFTVPSSKSQLGGGLDVNITNIRRLPDGRVTFHVGYEYQ